MSDNSPMMQQYERIKSDHTDAILFFRLGDFYEMFRTDAIEASRLLGLTLTQRQGTPMCGVPHHSSKTYIARLLDAGKKVAICEQVGVVSSGKGLADRQVVQILSPGTLLDEEYLGHAENNFLVSVSRLAGKVSDTLQVGIALCDLSTGELYLRPCSEAELVQELAGYFARWAPREVLVQESLLEENRELALFFTDKKDIVLNRFADWHYDAIQSYRRMSALMGLASLKSFGLEEGDSRITPLSAIIAYGENALRHNLAQLRSIVLVDARTEMRLDQASVRNLELVQNLRDSGKTFSLLAILDNAKTSMGSRLVKRWLLSPLQDTHKINERLDRVEYLYRHQKELSLLRETLASILDVERLFSRVLLDRANPKDLLALGKSLSVLINIDGLVSRDSPFPRWDEDKKSKVKTVAELLVGAIDDNPPVNHLGGKIIRKGYDKKVDEYRSLLENSEEIMENYVVEERVAAGLPGLKLRNNNIIGYYLEVTKSNLASVPPHFLRKQSMVGGERFTTERLSQLEDDLAKAQERSEELERDIFLALRSGLKPNSTEILDAADRVAELDAIASFAWNATARAYSRPIMRNDCGLRIIAGRHPVVEAVHGNAQFIPNDLTMAVDDEKVRTVLITGPNMAGKSTYLRQSALIVLMAHVGSFVPADLAEVGVVDSIFCRVGASDNLARGESTFLVEMNETAFILRNASEKSLVIMDEVGRGTSTQDGLSIARAVLEYLVASIKCRCMFATHFHELTAIAAEGLGNLSMSVEERNGRVDFLHRVQPGPSSNSYGIHVAELAGIPAQVIQRAKDVLGEMLTNEFPAVASKKRADQETAASRSQVSVAGPPVQVSLFSTEEEIYNELRSIKLETLTPLKALNLLAGWQDKIRVIPKKPN